MTLLFLPSVNDDAALQDNIPVLIARIMIKHNAFYEDVIQRHHTDAHPTTNILSVKKCLKNLMWLVLLVQISNLNLES